MGEFPEGAGPNQESDPTLGALRELLSTFGSSNPEEQAKVFDQALRNLDPQILPRDAVTSLLQEHAEGAASGDQTRRVEAFRFLGALLDYANGTDEHYEQTGFIHEPLSGEEAASGIADVMGLLKGGASDRIREACGLPNTPRPEDPRPVFRDNEHDIAAVILGTWFRMSQVCQERGLFLTPQMLVGTDKGRQLILDDILQHNSPAGSTPEQIKDTFDGILEKLPYILQRSILEQRQAKAYLRRDVDEL